MLKPLKLRWARDRERQALPAARADHREGVAVLKGGREIHFCGAYHPGECRGACGLPRLVRTRPDKVREVARVAMGICAVYCADLARGPWDGEVIEVEHPGDWIWR